jgi:Fe-S-cluster containining protein
MKPEIKAVLNMVNNISTMSAEHQKELLKITLEDFTKGGQCSRCGQCCGDFLPVTDDEIKKIKQYVKRYNIKPFRMAVLASHVIDASCVFFDQPLKRCRIYPVRPHICESFMCNMTPEEMYANKKCHLYDEQRMTRSLEEAIFGK